MATPKIDSYQFGQIVIDGQRYTKDLILFPDRIISNWWREQGHSLSVADLQEVLTTPPQVLIIGTGANGRMRVPRKTLVPLKKANIHIIKLESQEACLRYNEIREVSNVALAIHLTC